MSIMKIIETVDCPLCDGEIAVIVEDNKITSHGLCPKCDRPFSPDHLNFAQECRGYEDEFMAEESLFRIIENEIMDFYQVVYEKYLYVLYKQELEKMGGC